MPSVEAAFQDFLKALTNIFHALVNSSLAVVQAVLGLGKEVINAVIHLFNALLVLATDLTQDVIGFAVGECLLLDVSFGRSY